MSLAQNQFRLEGKVTESNTKEIVEMVAVQIKELNRWTTSDMNGNFVFKNIPGGTYTLQASCVGFEKYERPITIERDITGYKLMIKQSSLGLEEVTITAKENTSLSSSSRIENTALEHVQPTSLADVMQLVPGQITLNPDMSNSNQISIRTINNYASRDKIEQPDDNSALGTAIIVDGTPLSNDANMQTLNTAISGTSQGNSTAGQGIDLRQMSTDQIESIEVIRGIPSVEYGNLTSGAVLVKTKAGKTKLFAKLKSDPKIKQIALSKGFLLPGQNLGALNLDFDFTDAYADLIVPTEKFQRVTSQIGYSNTFLRSSTPLSLNLKLNYFRTIDDNKSDPDMLKTEIARAEEQSSGFKLYGNWSLKKNWISGIEYNFSGDYLKQENYEYKVVSGSTTPIPTSLVAGESIGTILPSSYSAEFTLDGRPYNYFATIKANLTGVYGTVENKLLAGVEWRTSGNNGKGPIYDLTRPPSGGVTTRPRAYSDVPASKDLAFYIEDKISLPIGQTKLNAQAGIRYNNFLPTGFFTTKGYRNIEPRINVAYDIISKKKNATLRDLTVRLGYGQTSKNPVMRMLYPDKAYRDQISFNYYPDLIVITTKIFENTTNPDLKPTTNDKYEIGVDFNLMGVKVMLTGFKENIRNGFNWEWNYYTFEYRKWNELAGAGKNPRFENGNVIYTENGQTKTLGYRTDRIFQRYQIPVNNFTIDKKGIEYMVDFGRIKSIRSNFIVDGAYYHITSIDHVIPYSELYGAGYQGQIFPYLSVYAGNEGKIAERLNSNIHVNTHIPKLRLITSLTGMLIWKDREINTWKDQDGHDLFYTLGANNTKQYGVFAGEQFTYVDPAGYRDLDGNYYEWKDNFSFEAPYSFMMKQKKPIHYQWVSKPFSWQINLKITKEIGSRAKLAFFANNIFNHRPLYFTPLYNSYDRRNQSAYFGAEIKLTL